MTSEMRITSTLIFFVLVISPNFLSAQCPYPHTQNSVRNAPVQVNQSITIANVYGKQYVRVAGLIADNVYEISTCSSNSFDTKVEVFTAGGGEMIAYNDDACGGTSSNIIFSPYNSGAYDIAVYQSAYGNCDTSLLPTSLTVTLLRTSWNTIDIPVVFHLLNYNETDSITDEQVARQLEILNKGVNRNYDYFLKHVPPYFRGNSGSLRVHFCLAQVDPNGNPTNGIERRKVVDPVLNGELKVKLNAFGGLNGWDKAHYLNVWVANTTNILGGFAGNTSTTGIFDGILVNYDYFALPSNAFSLNYPIGDGKTLIHEFGHWLGLQHIWGGSLLSPILNVCWDSDDIDDTPNQHGSSNNLNPNGVMFDACTSYFPGIMYQNFMDYTSDEKLNFFTIGQCEAMRNYLLNYRSSILSGNACTPVTTCPVGSICLNNNVSEHVCGGRFYDDGGNANYSNGQTFLKTFIPLTAGEKLKFSFTSFNTEHNQDYLKIYDGTSINSPLIGIYSGDLAPFSIQATNPGGAITFSWQTNTVSSNIGWVADISCINNSSTVPPGNYKKIEMCGVSVNPNTNNLEFMFNAYPAQLGDPIINVANESARQKKIFQTAIVIPSFDQWTGFQALPQYYSHSWGNVIQSVSTLPFRNTEMANRMFMADLYMKQFWDANLRASEYSNWSSLVNLSPYWGSLSQKGFNNYAFAPAFVGISPGQFTFNLSSNSIQISQATFGVSSSTAHTPYVHPGPMDLNLLTQQEKNDLNNRLTSFDNFCASTQTNREPAFRSLLNNHIVFDTLRQIYTISALAKKYKSWVYPNKPLASMIDGQDLTGLFVQGIPNQTLVDLWNQSSTLVPQFTQTAPFTSLYGAQGHITYGLCSTDGVIPIDSGVLNSLQELRDSVVYKNKGWIAQDSTIYFYGGTLDYRIADLTGIVHPQVNNYALGDTITVNATIFNFGNSGAQQFPVRLYEQYVNAQNQVQTILIGQQIVTNLDSFSNQSLTFSWIPLTYGSKKLLLTIDEGNAIIEKKETNNTAFDSLFIQNNIPIVSIISPSSGSAITNKNIVLSGTAYDPREGFLSYSNLSWVSDVDGFLGNGNFVNLDSLSLGNHTITFTGTNSHGQIAFAYINLYVFPQGFPIAFIQSPLNGDTLPDNDLTLFSGQASDLDEGSLCGNAIWNSNIAGNFGTSCENHSSLPLGNHTVTFGVTNSNNHTSVASIHVTVVPGSPTVTITQPSSSASFFQHQIILLQGAAVDYPQGNISNSIKWYSNIQGYLGAGQSVSTLLIPGNHIIIASIQDNSGSLDTASVLISIKFTPPVPTVSQPISNQTFNYRDTLSFIGHASDIQDGALHGTNLRWYSNINGFLGFGDTLKTSILSYGYHTISLKAIDHDNVDSTVTVLNIFIDAGQPSCVVALPINGSNFFYGDNIVLTGNGTDPQDGTLTGGSLRWVSDADGLIGTGSSVSTNALSAGYQTIMLTATDHDGFSCNSTTNFYIEPPHPPVASIYYPFNNNHFLNGTVVTFKANATDYEEGTLGNNRVAWSSSLNGSLGTGKTISIGNLTTGNHLISATVTDTTGLATTATIQIIIDQRKPVAQITSPSSGAIFSQGTSVAFTGTATDYENGVLTGNFLQWSSSVNGSLGSGNSINVSSFSVGSHLIRLIASDFQGIKDTAFITIIVQAPNTILQTKFSNGLDSISGTFGVNGGDTIFSVSLPKAAIVLNAQTSIIGRSALQASVTISANPSGTFTCGSPVIFTAVAINGGNNPLFQWRVNGLNVGSNSSTFNSNSLQNGDRVDVIMTSDLSCVAENSVRSNQIIISCTP